MACHAASLIYTAISAPRSWVKNMEWLKATPGASRRARTRGPVTLAAKDTAAEAASARKKAKPRIVGQAPSTPVALDYTKESQKAAFVFCKICLFCILMCSWSTARPGCIWWPCISDCLSMQGGSITVTIRSITASRTSLDEAPIKTKYRMQHVLCAEVDLRMRHLQRISLSNQSAVDHPNPHRRLRQKQCGLNANKWLLGCNHSAIQCLSSFQQAGCTFDDFATG